MSQLNIEVKYLVTIIEAALLGYKIDYNNMKMYFQNRIGPKDSLEGFATK